jgi:hypothetical protein
MAPTCSLEARPEPVMAALTSLGVSSSHQHRHPGSLRGAHHSLHIVLSEHPFDGHCCRPVTSNPAIDRLLDGHEATCDVKIGRRTDDINGNQQRLSPWNSVDHAQTASGQARVDPQHPHACPQLPRDRIAHAIPLALDKRTDVRQPMYCS